MLLRQPVPIPASLLLPFLLVLQKRDARLQMGVQLAKHIKETYPSHKIDCVMPIPDTSRTAALQVAYELGVPYREGFIKNRYIARTFVRVVFTHNLPPSSPTSIQSTHTHTHPYTDHARTDTTCEECTEKVESDSTSDAWQINFVRG